MSSQYPLMPVEHTNDLIETSGTLPVALDYEPTPLQNVHSILRGLYGWAIAVGLIFAIGLGAAGYFAPWFKPKFQSSGLIQITPVLPYILTGTEESTMNMQLFDSFVSQQVAVIKDQRVMYNAMKHPEWSKHGRPLTTEAKIEFNENLLVTSDRAGLIRVMFSDESKTAAKSAVKALIQSYEEVNSEEMLRKDRDRKNKLMQYREKYLAERVRLTSQRRALAERYGTDELDQLYVLKLNESQALAQQVKQLDVSIQSAELTMTKLNERNKADGDAEGEAGSEVKTPAEVAGNEGNLNLLEITEQSRRDAISMTESLSAEDIAVDNPQMQQYLRSKKQYEAEIEALMRHLGPEHRLVLDMQTRLGVVKADIEEYATEYRDRVIENIETNGGQLSTLPMDIAKWSTQLQMMKQAINPVMDELKAIGGLRQEINSLTMKLEINNDSLLEVEGRIEQLEVEQQVAGRVSIVSYGSDPLEPSQDRRKLIAVLGIMVGFAFGVGLMMLIGLSGRRRMRCIDDAEESIGRRTNMLGVLPKLPEDLADPEQAAMASRCVHQIRTLLQVGPESFGRRVFAITSPGPQDGKTSLTLSLGVSFAASGAKTLLIDCNMLSGADSLTGRVETIIRRKVGQILMREQLVTQQEVDQALQVAQESSQRLGETLIQLGYLSQSDLDQALSLQEQASIGLLDALNGEPLESCVAETGIDRLSILPIGAAAAHDVSKLSPTYINRLLTEARELYDIVLVDTGPVPASLEASHVAAEADGVVLTVSRGGNRGHAERAIGHLHAVGAQISGIVFNRAEGRDLNGLGESSLNDHQVAGVRKSTRKSFGPVARAVDSTSGTFTGKD